MRFFVLSAALLSGVLGIAPTAQAAGWGTLKGQVVIAGDAPARAELKVDKDQDACLKNGPLLSEKYVVGPKGGVQWVMVWLQDPTNAKTAPPIHPDLKEVKPKKLSVDQPTCMFEPHVLGLRQGQVLAMKNTAKVPHNVNVVGGVQGPNLNQIIPPGGSLDVDGFKPANTPVNISCTIHGWMKGYVRVFNHPYFAVTDKDGNFEIKNAPAGKWNLVVWQEEKGWVNGDKNGKPVTIKDGETTEEKIELKP